MDALISSALEEICYRGSSGGKLSPAPSPSVKATLWSNLLSVPTLRFSVAGKDKLFGPDDPEIQLVEDAEKLKLKVVANEHLRDCFVGLYDVPSCGVRPLQRRALERIAISREDGVTQSQLCKEFGMEGRNFFYIVKNLESRNLIVRQPAIVKTKEAGGAGEMKSSVSTNLMYLSRYATRLGAQQRFEINKEEHALGSLSDLEEADVDEENSAGDCLKDAVLVKDFIPAMQAICEKLEIANGNVLVITDIKKDLGYIGRFGHRAWRRDAGIVEEFDAKVNEKVRLQVILNSELRFYECTNEYLQLLTADLSFLQVERCIHLLKKFCPKLFETKQLRGSRACDENRQLKFGRKPKLNEQLLELPINQQIYDLIDENGTDGAIGIEVCSRLGLDKKKTYERFYDLVSRFGMHCQAENHKKTAVYRYWTSVHYNPQASNAQMDKLETSAGLPASASASRPFCIDAPDQTTLISSMNNRLISGVDCAYQRNLSDGGEDSKSSKFLEDGKANSGLVPDIDHVTSGAVSSAGLDLVCVDVESNGALSESSQISLLKQPSAHQTPVTADNSLREQRILEHIQKEKIVLRVVLHKLLLGLEKDKGTIMDRRTIDRILNKLQKEGHCRCVTFHVPSVTNCGRSRMAHVILHSSIESVLPEKVYDMLREFEKLSRQGSSRCKVDSVFPVLSGVNRTQAPVDSDGQAARSEAMRTNGFVLAKMVRAKLLHTFLWDYLSTSEEWDGNLSSGYKLFALQGAVKAIPLELFLQVAGSTQKIDNLVEKCKLGLRLRDLPAEEYRSLMDTLATGRLSVIIDLLRRLKVLHFYYDKHHRCLGTSEKNVEKDHQPLDNNKKSSRKQKTSLRNNSRKKGPAADVGSAELDELSDGVGQDMERRCPLFQGEHDQNSKADQEHSSVETATNTAHGESSQLSQYALSKIKPRREQRFSWTDDADRQLITQYARHRSILGVRFHRVDWNKVPCLPGPPRTCARRMASLKRNKSLRKAVMKLCNILSERFVKHLEKSQSMYESGKLTRVLHRYSTVGRTDGQGDNNMDLAGSKEEQWDDFNEKSVKEAFEDVILYKQVNPKASKGFNFKGDIQGCNIQEFVLPCTPSDNAQNLGHGKRSESRKRLRRHNLHQKFIKCLNESSDAGTELYKSVAVSNAVELLKLVFLSSSTTPDLQNMLGETLRHYSERDIFTAFSYLRDSKILIGGNGGPFVLSQHFLHNISKSPFPTNTGKRAAKFSNWLHDGKNYLIGGGIDLKEDLQCGDLFHLFARVSSGEMSVSPCLPDEGLGEADDLRISKRKAETDVPCDSEKAKKMKSMRDGELFSRREKGFPGIRVSICCEKILPVDALESLDDGKNGTDNSQKDKMECGFVQIDSHVPQSPNFDNITPSARLSGNSSWEAMSGDLQGDS
ncbi:hypothetical protein LINPERHAP1_LOCUS16885 [Linum perenne]